jgi:hypothetical protein
MLLLYILLLAGLAVFTAYTRNFQRTLVAIGARLDSSAAAAATTRSQGWRTAAMVVAWPSAIGLGMVFVAWWKAVGLVVAAFLVLVPVLGALTPRPVSAHYVERIRADLVARIERGAGDADDLRRTVDEIDRLSRERSPP